MAAYILSNALFYIKDILPITSGTGATFRISKDLERDLNIETGGVNAFVLMKNSAQIERMLVTCTGGVSTIVKRWLEQDGITENANLKKIWWDGSIGYISVKPDDFIALGKLDTAWGLRNTMLPSQNIWATNGSTAITVANTTGWVNGATITGTGIPGGATIVSFVPNTSAVLSASFTWTTGTVSVTVWIRYVTEIDTSWNEVRKPVSIWSSMSGSETIRKRKTDWTYEEITAAMLLSAAWLNTSVTPVESWIVAWSPIWIIQDWLYKVQTENVTSNTGTNPTIIFNIEKLSATTYAVAYSVTNTMYAVICTISWDTVTFWSPVTVWAWTNVQWGMARIGASKLAFVYMDCAPAFPSHPIYAIIGTVSWTSISLGSAVNVVSPSTSWTWTYSLWSCCRIRDDAFAFQAYDQAGGGWVYACTVSGTVPSAATTLIGTFNNANLLYLADNRIVTAFPTNGSAVWNIRMFEINPASLVITTTYTGSIGLTWWNWWTLARVSDTSFVAWWYSTINDANIYLFEKPWAGTVLTANSVWTLSAINHVLIPIYDGIYWIHTWSSIIVRDGKEVIWTIASVPALPSPPLQLSTPIYSNWRLFFHSQSNLTSRIVRLARAMYSWIATDTLWGFKPRFTTVPFTWAIYPYVYYMQLDWTINRTWYTSWATRIWRAVASNTLLIE